MTGDNISRILRIAGLVLVAFGAIILFKIYYTDIEAAYSQRKMHDEWMKEISKHDSEFQEDPRMLSASRNGKGSTNHGTTSSTSSQNQKTGKRFPVAHMKPFARIVIPRIKLDAIVVEGVDVPALKLGPGHMEETAFPGEVGNMVISGHRVTYSHPFYYLDQLKEGDTVEIHTSSRKFVYYMVKQKVVDPTDVSVIAPTKDKTLTLTTCNPRYSARTRLIIVAKMLDESKRPH